MSGPIIHIPIIHIPTDEENKAALAEFFGRQKQVRAEQRAAAVAGLAALDRLVAVLKENHFTGQPYKLRELLYSLWNGKPAELSELLGLDWELRKDICAVMAGFGYEDEQTKLFYRAIEDRLKAAHLFDWFLEERLNIRKMDEYVKAVQSEQK